MARPRPRPARPGRPGVDSRRPPGFAPPSSQPAGPPGRAVRLRALAPPPEGRGPERRALIGPRPWWEDPEAARPYWAALQGAGLRVSPPPGGDSGGGSGSQARSARVGARPPAAAHSQGVGARALPRALSVSGPLGSKGLPARAVSPEKDWKAQPCARASGTGRGPGTSRTPPSWQGRGPTQACPWGSLPEEGSGPTREPGLSEPKKRLTYVPSKQRAAHPAVKSREQAAPLRVPAVPPTLGPRMAHGWARGSQSLGADTRRGATRCGEPRGCR